MQKKSWIDFGKRDKSHNLALTKFLYGDGAEKPPVKQNPKRKVKRSITPIEKDIQKSIVQWCKNMGVLIHSIPNHGKRSRWAGQQEKEMGLYPGASDLFLAKAHGGYHGYYIEVKAPGKKPTPQQIAFGETVKRQGYKWSYFDDFETAKRIIGEYLTNN